MSCNEIRPGLIAYHFNVAAPEERAAIEAHLPACRACIAELIALKRAIELGEDGPRPSTAARDRLRQAVAGALRGPEPRRRWWDRPVAFAFAGSAVLAAMFAMHVLTSGPGEAPGAVRTPATPATPVSPSS
jgi:anti-sigma factor RsiW